jgi:metal-dependent amidase/aminoacylase/carboxypeptidase family protein
MAILCGLAIELHRSKPRQEIILLFQPAEEDGAQKVFSDTKFAAFNPDYVLPYIIYLDIKKSDYSKK